MKDLAYTAWDIFGIFILVMLWIFFSTMIAGGIISGLPRPIQGEAPDGSKMLCLGIVLLIQWGVPFLMIVFSKIHWP